jgi:VWFA-related protein
VDAIDSWFGGARLTVILLVAWVQLPLALSQELPTDQDIFRSQSNLVLVPTLVKDTSGKIVYGLQVDNFEILDDGVPQPFRLDETPEAEPISLVIALQVGGRAGREFQRIQGISAMLDPVLRSPDTEAALLLFDKNLNLEHDFTGNADVIEKDLKLLDRGDDGASILDAVAYSVKLLSRRPAGRKRVLLLISETRDHGSHVTNIDEVVHLIGSTNTAVYALPFSPYVSEQLDVLRGANRDEWQPGMDFVSKLVALRNAMKQNTPKTLTAMTGGEYGLFMTRKSFEANLSNFANHLDSRYLLSFAPKNPHPGLHDIRVRMKDPANKLTLLFRKTYWAAEVSE